MELDPNVCQLAPDTYDKMITKDLAEKNKAIKIIDYTGSSAFGSYLEGLAGKIVFPRKKTGVNFGYSGCPLRMLIKVAQNFSFFYMSIFWSDVYLSAKKLPSFLKVELKLQKEM